MGMVACRVALMLATCALGTECRSFVEFDGNGLACLGSRQAVLERFELSVSRSKCLTNGMSTMLRIRGGVREVESTDEWDELLQNENRLLVVDFTATWCGPCQRIAPAYAALAEEFEA